MQHVNVYVEEMTKHIPSHLLPITSKDDVIEALAKVQEIDDSYRNKESGELMVDTDWHANAMLDFVDWILAHCPYFTRSLIGRALGHFPMFRDWLKYDAIELMDELCGTLMESVQGMPATHDELSQAQCIASMLLSYNTPLTLSVYGDVNGIEDVLIPAAGTPMSEPDGVTEDVSWINHGSDRYWTHFFEVMLIVLACIRSELSVLSYTTHLGTAESLGMMLFSEGHMAPISQSDYPSLLEIKMEEEEIFTENLSDFVPKDAYGTQVLRGASAIVLGIQSQLGAAWESATGTLLSHNDAPSTDITLSVSEIPSLVVLEGEGEGFCDGVLGPAIDAFPTLCELYSAVRDISPEVTSCEASAVVSSASISLAACDLLIDGKIAFADEKVEDICQQAELGLSDISLCPAKAALLIEHSETLSQDREMKIAEEIFDAKPPEQKAEVERLITNIELDESSFKTVFAVEGELDEEQPSEPGKALLMQVPASAFVPDPVSRDASRLLRQLCVQAFNAPSMTMFVTSRGHTDPNNVNVSAVQWKNGKWEDLGEEKAMFFATSTSIASMLQIYPDDSIEYKEFYK